MKRHRWSQPQRFASKTERYCTRCGLIKVTRHVDDGGRGRGIRDHAGRLVSIEWWKVAGSDGMPERLAVDGTKTPECTAVQEVWNVEGAAGTPNEVAA